jgi:hypothetical protein
MNVLAILEVAIGIIFVWFLLSVLVSTVQEAIANIFKWRGKGLEQAVRQLLEDPSDGKQAVAQLGTKFYEHPLIRSLSKDINKRRPSYIPASQFAEVVFDLVVDAGSSTSPLEKVAQSMQESLKGVKDEIGVPAQKAFEVLLAKAQSASEGRSTDQTVMKALEEDEAKLVVKYPFLEPAVVRLRSATSFPPLLTELGQGIESLRETNSHLAESLDILINRTIQNTRDADEALAKARKNVETWFDNSMERLSGNYKRRVQLYAFVIGLAVALFLNVDSIAILRTLWSDQGLRASIALQAQQMVQTGEQNASQQTPQQIINQLGALQLPVGWTFITEEAAVQGQPQDTRCKDYLGSFYGSTRCLFPAGYDPRNGLYRITFWESLLGALVTAIATMQGSPFWFGVLSKIVNMRASTPPAPQVQPAKS